MSLAVGEDVVEETDLRRQICWLTVISGSISLEPRVMSLLWSDCTYSTSTTMKKARLGQWTAKSISSTGHHTV